MSVFCVTLKVCVFVCVCVVGAGEGLPRWLIGKESTCNAGETGLIPGSGRSPGEGHGNPFQYSCLENPMNRGAWWARVHGSQRVEYNLVTKQREKYAVYKEEPEWGRWSEGHRAQMCCPGEPVMWSAAQVRSGCSYSSLVSHTRGYLRPLCPCL